MSLATKYRPNTFEDVCGQKSIIKILKKQISDNKIKNTYLFCGASGCGKTTLARIFANQINDGCGYPIEIDAASNNGVDNVKTIVKQASERAIDAKYKVYIIDECHAITNQGWQAFLKCIEEPPQYTIFIFCTTDPQKIPATIINRVMRFNISRLDTTVIENRLKYICKSEGFTNYEYACNYISKICKSQMRDAVALLEKCADYDTNLDMENVITAIGDYSLSTYLDLLNAIIDGKETSVIKVITDVYNSGIDIVYFVNNFLSFIVDVSKYLAVGNICVTKFPNAMEEEIKKCTNFENASKYYNYLLDKTLLMKNTIKGDIDPRTTVEVMLLQMARLQ